jgi:hydroxyethylthiazole kinase-like uncharacterized protein yjeF
VIPIVTAEEMRAIDAASAETTATLVERAGSAVGRSARRMLGGTYGRTVNVLVGTGNNGADGRVAATWLRDRGVRVRLFEVSTCPALLPAADLLIDAAYGTGFRVDTSWNAPVVGETRVLAVDIPSGLDARDGRCAGQVLTAEHTVTFQALKPGMLIGDGPERCGTIEVVDIGLDTSVATAHLVEMGDVAAWWPRRSRSAHKWNGAVRVIAGSASMRGAARLCSAAAARSGASLVSLSVPGGVINCLDEIIQPPIDATGWSRQVVDDLSRFGALGIGPGLGRTEATIDATRQLIADAMLPVVIDGDAIYAAAWSADGPAPLLTGRTRPTVLTPHDGEFALLTGAPPEADRFAAVRRVAAELGCTVLLKGPTTLVADPDGDVLAVDRGDQRLATAGTGDVLAGMIVTMLASGIDPSKAAAGAAWVHAQAARTAPRPGMLASDIIDRLPATISALGEPHRVVGNE